MSELTRRYIVMALATEAPFDMKDPDAPFVLKPWKDPAALQALIAYREHCYPELAQELDQWIGTISGGPKIRGGVGSRNELMAPSRAKSPSRTKPKVKGKRRQLKPVKKRGKRRS